MTSWSQIGSWHGGSVHALALSPDFERDGVALATTSAGVYRTIDSGQHWSLTSAGFVDPAGLAVAFAADSASVVFASSPQGRLYRSSDGGVSWRVVNSWSGLGLATTITLSPTYAQDKTLFVATSEGVFRSLNDGIDWQEASFGLLDLDVLCLLCAPDFGESETLWAGTALGGLYRSRNAGRAWRESGTGLPDCAIQSIAFSPHHRQDRRLFVGSEEDGVYISHDDGASWQRAGQELAGLGVNALALSSSIKQIQIVAATTAGLFRSGDGGESWQACSEEALLAFDVKLATNGVGLATLYQQGIARTEDSGETWRLIEDAVVAHAPPLVAATDEMLYLLDETGLLTTFDNAQFDKAQFDKAQFGSSQFDSAQKAWAALSPPSLESEIVALAVVGVESTTSLFVATAQRVYKLEDGTRINTDKHGLVANHLRESGQSALGDWQELALESAGIMLLAVSPGYAIDRSLGVANSSGQLFLSVDGGEVWQARMLPWRSGNPNRPAETLLQLLISPFFAADGTIFAISGQGNEDNNITLCVWQSVDQGQQWESLATFESAIASVLTVQPVDPLEHALFLATQHRFIKLFTNSAGQFAVEQHFFAEDDSITAMVASPNYETDRTLYAATRWGIHTSYDGGTTWRSFAPSLARPVVALIVQPTSNRLLAVTLGGEIWECALGALST